MKPDVAVYVKRHLLGEDRAEHQASSRQSITEIIETYAADLPPHLIASASTTSRRSSRSSSRAPIKSGARGTASGRSLGRGCSSGSRRPKASRAASGISRSRSGSRSRWSP